MTHSVMFSKDSLGTLLPFWGCRCINEPDVIFLGINMQTEYTDIEYCSFLSPTVDRR
jgi:hypothetical protein